MSAETIDQEHQELVACHSCDLLHVKTRLPGGGKAYCSRCGELLYSDSPRAIEIALALSLASLFLFISAHMLPFISINVEGNSSTIYLISTIEILTDLENRLLALGGIIFLLVAPLAILLIDATLLLRLRFAKPGMITVSRQLLLLAGHMTPWNMLEIFLLGVLVSIVKLASMSEITLHEGFWAFVGLVVINLIIAVNIHPDTLWRALEAKEH
jgi:paraquat-inducible protein A